MRHFPLFLALDGERVVIVGGGEGAAQKFRLLSRTTATITLMAETLVLELAQAVADGRAVHAAGTLCPADFAGARLVIVVTGCAALDAAAADLARARGALVNVVDRPALSDVIMPAIVDRDPVVVAIGTEGTAPVLARQIKSRLEIWLEPSLGRFAAELGSLRPRIAHRVAPGARRRFWEWLVGAPRELFAEGREHDARARIAAALDAALVPGAEDAHRSAVSVIAVAPRDMMTLAALRRLQSADLILHGAGAGDGLKDELDDVLELARRDAERAALAPGAGPARWHVERGARQAAAAQGEGHQVVWLTDSPAEAAAALTRLGVPAETVPVGTPPSAVVACAEDG